jgi:predicted neutral ceramidase superfamily lipid hydrolase
MWMAQGLRDILACLLHTASVHDIDLMQNLLIGAIIAGVVFNLASAEDTDTCFGPQVPSEVRYGADRPTESSASKRTAEIDDPP